MSVLIYLIKVATFLQHCSSKLERAASVLGARRRQEPSPYKPDLLHWLSWFLLASCDWSRVSSPHLTVRYVQPTCLYFHLLLAESPWLKALAWVSETVLSPVDHGRLSFWAVPCPLTLRGQKKSHMFVLHFKCKYAQLIWICFEI